MSKARMLGYNNTYIPNNRVDKRKKKRGRNPADRIIPSKKEAAGDKKA